MENDELTIDLVELFGVLRRKCYLILLTGILTGYAAFAVTQTFITPKYTSSTSMYMLAESGDSGLTYNDLQTSTQLTQDYMEITKSRTVLEKVIATLNLDMTVEELNDIITTTNIDDTRIMTIEVEHEDPELAQDIADAVRETASNKIEEIMDIETVNTIEEANYPTSPSSPSVVKNTAVGAGLGALCVVGFIILFYIVDDTIKSPDDADNYLGLNVLASIPIQDGKAKPRKKKYSKRKTASRMKH